VAIFKNEAHILKEWLQHYRRQGVDHFFLIDNGSTDVYLPILSPYIYQKTLTLSIDPTRNEQTALYNRYCLSTVKTFDWVLVCDLDEFVYARRGYSTITEYLTSLAASVSQVIIPWKLFGSNGFDTIDKPQPTNVVKNFTRRIDYDRAEPPPLSRPGQVIKGDDSTLYTLKKSINRTKNLKALDIHYCHLRAGTAVDATGTAHPLAEYTKINETILAESFLHLNHYVIQSLDWFTRVKMTRGDSNGYSDTLRNREYFVSYDINEKEDTELANRKKLP
jgi:hypothetical protein